MIIAVDFDGTIVEHKYPQIGKEIPFAITTLKKLQQENHLLILWTVREGELLEEAITFCHKRGLDFYAVNRNYPEEPEDNIHYCRKINADIFIDDRNVGGLPDWGIIYKMISSGQSHKDLFSPIGENTYKKQEREYSLFFQGKRIFAHLLRSIIRNTQYEKDFPSTPDKRQNI